MVEIKTLLPELRELVIELAEDLLARATSDSKIGAGLKEAFQQIEKGGRTAQAFEVWRDDYLDQVAVAWILACVFVRFMEDNHLIDECWLAGEGERRKLAEDTHELYFREHPHDTDREYFQYVFKEVGKIPAAKDLFAEGKTPLWAVAPSGDAAMNLLKFWRDIDAEQGNLKRSIQVENGDTRFLGDLYQDLSERAKKKFALLQTPVFVEEFILDRTLTPALAEFGLEKIRMIDPTCGSGHFLLGGFARLFDLWSKPEHTTGNAEKDAQNALDGVWGVDINPFAVAIARFRLIVAAVKACGIKRLKQAPGWNIHLASGDSLLFGSKPGFGGGRTAIAQQSSLFEAPEIYAVEDRITLQQILGQGYQVVVGNPPYIIVRDEKQNAAYRALYSTCHQKYSLGVPFTQRFFELGVQQNELTGGCGYIGMITTNAFMKREFGKKLIEEFFPKIDLTNVIDTSGAHIPGHGTPTVILFGRSRKPVGETVRAVLGIKGEATTPEDATQGFVWRSIVKQIDMMNAQDEYTSTADVPRSTFNSHPWSIGGGGAAQLRETIEGQASTTLRELSSDIGFMAISGEDDAFAAPEHSLQKKGLTFRRYCIGQSLRDWVIEPIDCIAFPYDESSSRLRTVTNQDTEPFLRTYWRCRSILRNRTMFGKSPEEHGLAWFEYMQFIRHRAGASLSLAFGEIATHNHFVLDRGGKVYKHSAQIITLPAGATEDDHLSLLGLLNSSVACFWMKQTCHDKGGGGIGGGLATEFWEHFFDYTGTKLSSFPVCDGKPLALARQLDALASKYSSLVPEATLRVALPTSVAMTDAHTRAKVIRGQMIANQEELDWQCYQLYGLLTDDLRYNSDNLPELALGERAFEIVMARQIAKGELETAWFERHASAPIPDLPKHWSPEYRKLVERRIKLIETNKEIGLIERPEYKRRWNAEPWQEQEQRALKNWLLDRLEEKRYWPRIELQSTAQLADRVTADADFMQVAALYRGRADFDLAALVAELVEGEAIPFLPILRYKPAGLRKREVWERTWDLQRQEDVGKEVGEIPVPPKYVTADFLKTNFWRLRGKLDVPKERWISYPHCSTDSDPTLVIGWAGWNHLEQATALIAYYDARKREGWDANRLTPLLAGLDQLLPWIHQWHSEIDSEFGETAGQSFQTLLQQDSHELGITLDDIRKWQPSKTTTARRQRART